MAEGALEVFGAHRSEDGVPALVEGFEEGERDLDGRLLHVGELGPAVFGVGLDGGLVLGQAELEADVGVHVAVRHVMDHLADGPAAVAVGGVELPVVEAGDGGAEGGGGAGDGGDGFLRARRRRALP